jgi:hypothetical protein
MCKGLLFLKDDSLSSSSFQLDGGVWDFEICQSNNLVLIANMYNGISFVNMGAKIVVHNHKLPDELIYGVTQTGNSIYCCSFISGLVWRFDQS